MLTTNGFLPSKVSSSCHIKSLARALPPGLSTRKTIAFTVESSRAWRMALMIVVEPIDSSPRKSAELFPETIGPTALMIAILAADDLRGAGSTPIIRFIILAMPVMPLKSVSSFFLPYPLANFTSASLRSPLMTSVIESS